MSDRPGTTTLRVAFFTLGCKLNQYESDALASQFRLAAYQVVEAEDGADIFVVNSCTVTNRADRKSRNLINRVERQLGQARLVVETGCFSPDELDRPTLDARILRVENRHKSQIFSLVQERLARLAAVEAGAVEPDDETVTGPGPGDPFGFLPGSSGFHTRGIVKIQDGCDSFCAYCIIPSVRGKAISRPQAAILEEIRQLTAAGFREIILTGVNISRWSEGRAGFSDLVAAILNLDLPARQDFRLRLSSLEPEGLGPDFAALFGHHRLCPSLHLCLQSGSPRILAAMKRSYSLDEFRRLVRELRSVNPDFCLSTDLITGFPGETTLEFAASLAAISEFDFWHVHVFPFSRRQGTVADRLEGQLPERLKDERADLIRQADRQRQAAWFRRFAGKNQHVLVETIEVLPGFGYRFKGLGEAGLPLQLDIGSDQLASLIASLPQQQRSVPPHVAQALRESHSAGQVWNQVIPVRIPEEPDCSGNSLPCQWSNGLA